MLGRLRFGLCLMAWATLTSAATAGTELRLDPEPDWRNAESLSELIDIFDTWLDENTDFVRPDNSPTVSIVSASVAASIQGLSGASHGRARGLFDPETSSIYLIEPWDRRNAHDASVLLHELVHARQVSRYYYCPGAQEEAAYRLQDKWLRERGLQAKVNWIAVVLESGCASRDIHPD